MKTVQVHRSYDHIMDEIEPDTKDWTWVLDNVCPECDYDVRDIPQSVVGTLIRSNAHAWREELKGNPTELRLRPRPNKWSTLEYSGHVRDVFRLYLYRLDLMLTEDGPQYPDWNQDETALAEDYNSQDPAILSTELMEAAERLAERFDGVVGEQWDRTGYRGDGAAFTIISFARYLIHDPVHHLWDLQN